MSFFAACDARIQEKIDFSKVCEGAYPSAERRGKGIPRVHSAALRSHGKPRSTPGRAGRGERGAPVLFQLGFCQAFSPKY
jgi:hypothetical protein